MGDIEFVISGSILNEEGEISLASRGPDEKSQAGDYCVVRRMLPARQKVLFSRTVCKLSEFQLVGELTVQHIHRRHYRQTRQRLHGVNNPPPSPSTILNKILTDQPLNI